MMETTLEELRERIRTLWRNGVLRTGEHYDLIALIDKAEKEAVAITAGKLGT